MLTGRRGYSPLFVSGNINTKKLQANHNKRIKVISEMIDRFCRLVDLVNEWSGRIGGWLFVPFILLTVTDVFTRYVLNHPWYYLDINKQFLGSLAVLGAGYCYLHKGHVYVDILVTRLSRRGQAIVELCLFPLILGALVPMLWKIAQDASNAVRIRETLSSSALYVPVYQFKCLLAFGVLLMILQAISFFFRNLKLVFTPKSGAKP